MHFNINIKKAIQEFSYRNFNSIVVFETRDLKAFQINDPDRPYFYEKMYNTSIEDQAVVNSVLDEYFVLPSELKRTFYKAWDDVTKKTRTELLIDQIIHYWDFNVNSIPNENVAKLPNEMQIFAKEIKVIKSISFNEFSDLFMEYIYSATTIDKKDINLLRIILEPMVQFINEKENFEIRAEEIVSKELKNIAYDVLYQVPEDAEEFMRFFIFKLTGSTLLIKNGELLNFISYADKEIVLEYLNLYLRSKQDFIKLAKIFNRFKPFFLAMKTKNNTHTDINKIVNKISKLSKKYHEPKITQDYLQLTEGNYTVEEVRKIAEKLDTVYLVKLYNAFSYRTLNPKVLIYQVRNGKVFIKENKYYDDDMYRHYCITASSIIYNILKKRIKENILENGISFKNTESVDVAVPTSGKQFVGSYPFYSSFNINWKDENAYVGIYWKNKKSERIDLDLSLINAKAKLGWNAYYYNDDAIYSGDITDAPNGAVEAFKLNSSNEFYIINVNTFSGEAPIDAKLFIGKDKFSTNGKSDVDMFENATIPFNTKITLESKQENIGFVLNDSLVLCKLRIGNSNVSTIEKEDIIKSYTALISSKLKLNDFYLSYVIPQEVKHVIDFENPDKDILMKLVK